VRGLLRSLDVDRAVGLGWRDAEQCGTHQFGEVGLQVGLGERCGAMTAFLCKLASLPTTSRASRATFPPRQNPEYCEPLRPRRDDSRARAKRSPGGVSRACTSGDASTRRRRFACARRWNRWGRSSSSSARCCPPAATFCARHRRRTGQAAGPRAALFTRTGAGADREGLWQAGQRSVRRVRRDTGGQCLDRAGPFRPAATEDGGQKWRSRSCARKCTP
jgi:hypothetical protein